MHWTLGKQAEFRSSHTACTNNFCYIDNALTHRISEIGGARNDSISADCLTCENDRKTGNLCSACGNSWRKESQLSYHCFPCPSWKMGIMAAGLTVVRWRVKAILVSLLLFLTFPGANPKNNWDFWERSPSDQISQVAMAEEGHTGSLIC